ncbi:MAG: DUF3472 domain-containing protein, partial [Armatimonadetes bacterium]|nr:DUF3472 domain-containing protein [Armatimonadota bacterium]
MSRRRFLGLAGAGLLAGGASAQEPKPPRAARSVHLGYPAPDSTAFTIEMVVRESVPGSYFMAAGWNTGYFGIQELADRRKVILFSVWDPTKGDDPTAVRPGERVECLFQDPDVRIRRFGGEGTGGQCMGNFPWEPGETYRFLVEAAVEGQKTAYTGSVARIGPGGEPRAWRKLVTFRTRTGGLLLKGLYSFVEDFRRDTRSATERRRAQFGGGWARSAAGDWVSLARARFTASGAEWEAKETINSGREGRWFFLETGGATRQSVPLRTVLE